MEIVWKIENDTGCSIADWCDLIIRNDDIYYAFDEINENKDNGINIGILKINSLTGKYTKKVKKFLSSEINKFGVNWRFFINNNNDDIILFAKKFIKVSEGDIVILPDNYAECVKDEIRYGSKLRQTYRFENFIIKYSGATLIKCFDKNTGNELWRYSFNIPRGSFQSIPIARLAEIEYKKGHIIFLKEVIGFTGTEQLTLSCIELSTGIVKVDNIVVNYNYAWDRDTMYISDRTGNLLEINPFENKIIQKIEFLEGKMSFCSPIKIINDKIYTILKNMEDKPIIICIKK